jgi:DtxR family Mn-dependent transcriptional regulator
MAGVILSILIICLTVGLFWPRGGLVGLIHRFRDLSRKEQVEHALKHLHHCEYSKLVATPESLAGAVRISRQRAIELIRRMEATDLVTTSGGRIELTGRGRQDALRVIRIHRLWEKYFADESGLDESLWHDEADRREHTTTEDESNELAARLGYPRYDPHGAPIPTPSGELPSTRGETLSDAKPGTRGRVVHVEDEPRATYEQLATQGVTVGATVEIVDRSPDGFDVKVDGKEQVLVPVATGNVSIEPLEPSAPIGELAERLSQLQPGRRGRVVRILPSCRGVQRRRLLDLGFLSGTIVEAELQGLWGDPRAYRLRGTLIALREDQSNLVQIERLPEEQTS